MEPDGFVADQPPPADATIPSSRAGVTFRHVHPVASPRCRPLWLLQRSSFLLFFFAWGNTHPFAFSPTRLLHAIALASASLPHLGRGLQPVEPIPSVISRRRGPNTRRHAAACVGSVLHTSGRLDARHAFLKREGVQGAEQSGRKRKHGAGRAGCRKTPAPRQDDLSLLQESGLISRCRRRLQNKSKNRLGRRHLHSLALTHSLHSLLRPSAGHCRDAADAPMRRYAD